MDLDASFGEGGGSILRVAAGLACVFHQPLHVFNIRKNRNKPGLRLQHLVGVQTLANLTNGKINHLDVGSTDVEFSPGSQWKSSLDIQIRTAGNVGLLTQTIQNALYLAPETQDGYHFHVLGGGTYGKYAPGVAYLNNVTFQIFKTIGFDVQIDVLKQGFYPKGGAKSEIIVRPHPKNYHGINWEKRGDLVKIDCIVHVEERLKQAKVAERIISSIEQNISLNIRSGINITTKKFYQPSLSVGVGVDAWLTYSNGVVVGCPTVLGERGISSEKVGRIMAKNLKKLLQSSETVDVYASDQILPLLTLIDEPSCFKLEKITSHFQTNWDLLDKFIPRKRKITKLDVGYLVELL
ncbi:MAG: RNA 3'-terminal phosphate cyclase [Promethearchaeota archaeon]